MDRLDAMSLLLDVVEAGSLSAAGRRLGIPLTTVSRRIVELESRLNARLLNRSTRQLSLTDAGVAYAERCRRILEEVGEAERAAAGEYSAPRGELVITAPVAFGRLHVLPVMTEFLRLYPEIKVRLVLADRLLHLMEDHVDLAVRLAELPASALVAIRLGTMRRVVCASPDYLARRGRPETPDALRDHDCIAFEGLASSDAWCFGSGRSQVLLPVRSRLSVSTAEAAVDAAASSFGLTQVQFYQVEEACRHGRLVTVLEAFEPPPWPVQLVHAGQPGLPLKLRTCLDFLTPRLRQRMLDCGRLRAG